jgi:peptide/nickel transport system permease protein
MTLGRFLARRLGHALTAMLVTSIVLFVLLMSGPDPLAQLQQEGNVDVAQLAHEYGWDRPWVSQYASWAGGFVRGDWGVSIRTGEPAARMIASRATLTIVLTLLSTAMAAMSAVVAGVWAARRRGSRSDRWVTGTMVAVGALPSFLIALLMQWAAATFKDTTGTTLVYVGGMPRDGGALEYVQRLALPVLVLALMQFATLMRFQRAELIAVFDDDAYTAARARGLGERTLVHHHALPRTYGPLATLIGLELGTLFGGTLIVETVFGLPGVGRLLADSVLGRDVVVALDLMVLGSASIIMITALLEVLIARIDPRVATPA